MKVGGTSLSSRSSVSSAGVPLGNLPPAPKAMGLCFFRTFQFRCLRLARQAPSLSFEIVEFQRLGANSAPGRGGPWDEEGGGGSEGARKRTADAGVEWSPAGPDSESKHPWGGRGGGPQGSGPSAAARRLVPEERAVGGIS